MPNFSRRTIGGPDRGTSRTLFLDDDIAFVTNNFAHSVSNATFRVVVFYDQNSSSTFFRIGDNAFSINWFDSKRIHQSGIDALSSQLFNGRDSLAQSDASCDDQNAVIV